MRSNDSLGLAVTKDFEGGWRIGDEAFVTPGHVLGGTGCGANTHQHYAGDMQMKSRYHIAHIADELGAFIHQWSWDLFMTLTFRARFPMSSDRVKSQWHRLISSINRGQRKDAFGCVVLRRARSRTYLISML